MNQEMDVPRKKMEMEMEMPIRSTSHAHTHARVQNWPTSRTTNGKARRPYYTMTEMGIPSNTPGNWGHSASTRSLRYLGIVSHSGHWRYGPHLCIR